jgi:hypothetical protein
MAAKKSIRSMLVIKKSANNNTKQKAQIFCGKESFCPLEIMWGCSSSWLDFQRAPLPYVPALESPILGSAGSHPKNDGMLEYDRRG